MRLSVVPVLKNAWNVEQVLQVTTQTALSAVQIVMSRNSTEVQTPFVPITALLVLPWELHLNATHQAQLLLLRLLSLPMVHG